MSYHVDKIPNRNSPPAILFRRAWREGKRIRRVTLANLTRVPEEIVDGIRAMLKGGIVVQSVEQMFTIKRSLPHGHVAAVLGTCRKLGLERILHRKRSRSRDLALGAIVARLLSPCSKLATARSLSPDSCDTSLGAVLGLGEVRGNEMLGMLDWLVERQRWIEKSLANRHLEGGCLILYDVTSSYFEGDRCSLAAFGYNRDGKKGKKQIVFGMLCSSQGCPVAVEVFAGNTGDPATVASQVNKIRERFGVENVALVGDRGMITTARVREDLEPWGVQWISALKSADIRSLLKEKKGAKVPLRLEEVIADRVAQIVSPHFAGERLMVCYNPRLGQRRAVKREELLVETERILENLARIVRNPNSALRGRDNINRRVGREANRKKVEKHFDITVTDEDMVWSRNQKKIDAEAKLDGIYVVRTSLSASDIKVEEAVEAYKSLSRVERAFRSMKTSSLEVRPIYVYSENHVRGHVFLCMLAYYVEWHMRRALAPVLFEDDDREEARAARNSVVEPAEVSRSAKEKADTKKTAGGLTVHSFSTLMRHLATVALNMSTPAGRPDCVIPVVTEQTPTQRRAFELLEIDPRNLLP